MNFGLKPPPASSIRSWGARAILNRNQLDILHDRQTYTSHEGEAEADRHPFFRWLNMVGLPHLKERRWDPSSRDVYSFGDGPFVVEASTQGSHGYLYITAYEASAYFDALEEMMMEELAAGTAPPEVVLDLLPVPTDEHTLEVLQWIASGEITLKEGYALLIP